MFKEPLPAAKVTDFKSSCLEPAAALDTAVCSTWKTLPGFIPVSIYAQFNNEIESTCVNCHTSMFV